MIRTRKLIGRLAALALGAAFFAAGFTACSNPLGGEFNADEAASRAAVPVYGPAAVTVGDELKVTFYEDINASTLTASTVTLVRTATGEVLECRISYANRVATIAPVYRSKINTAVDISKADEWNGVITTGFKPATAYTLTLKTGIKNSAGAAATLPAAWNFTTADLDLGLYFYGADGEFQKYVPGVANRFYSASKKTYLYFHGWQSGAMASDYRREACFYQNAKFFPSLNMLPALINAGYNVAAYNWGQFADEAEVQDAEAKVWSGANNYTGKDGAKVNMRYKLSSGAIKQYSTAKSVADLATDTVKQALSGNTSGYIHVVGHSLGNQMATVVAGKLADAGYPVKRLALLDAFWSKSAKAYLANQWPGAACRTLVKDLISAHGVAVEQYKSSALGGTIGDENLDMRKMTNFNRIWPDFIGGTDQTNQHVYAYVWYNQSIAKTVPAGSGTIGAAATDAAIKSLMNYGKSSTYYYYTSTGKSTAAASDDTFVRGSGVSTW